MGTAKKKRAKTGGKGLGGAIKTAGKKLLGGGGAGGKRKRKGVTYWQNKVLIEKLKKKYSRLKYGSVR